MAVSQSIKTEIDLGLDHTNVTNNDVKTMYFDILTASGDGLSINDEVSKWVTFAADFSVSDLSRLNEELSQKSVLFLGNGLKVSEIDCMVFSAIHSSVTVLSCSEREKLPHVMRWMDYIQFKLKAEKSAATEKANTNPQENANATENAPSNTHWQWEEDKLLISAWLNVSKDALVSTDQTSDKFWNRISMYCHQSNPGLIKRGAEGKKKRWGRINMGAQEFGSCHSEASRKIGNSSNNNDVMELAYNLYQAKYKKKCNFDRHWHELRKEHKWRSQSTDCEGSKRTKINASGAYSSSSNSETPSGKALLMDSLVSPQGTKVAGRKSKEKLKESVSEHALKEGTCAIKSKSKEKLKESATEDAIREELCAVKSAAAEKLSVMSEYNRIKEKEIDMQLLYADTSKMSEVQLEIHTKLLERLKEKSCNCNHLLMSFNYVTCVLCSVIYSR